MYEDGADELDRILELTKKCSQELQPKAFELLLSGYVQSQLLSMTPATKPTSIGSEGQVGSRNNNASEQMHSHAPPALQPRFKTFAKRHTIELEKLEGLFDFNVDPFVFNALTVPGENKADITRKAVLLVAARSYFTTGSWTADWAEVKSLCVDQNCYDGSNHAAFLKKGAGSIFKSVETGKTIELASEGIKEAEKLIKQLTGVDSK